MRDPGMLVAIGIGSLIDPFAWLVCSLAGLFLKRLWLVPIVCAVGFLVLTAASDALDEANLTNEPHEATDRIIACTAWMGLGAIVHLIARRVRAPS